MVKRIEWVDVGKFFCIMFVMLSHLESNTELLNRFYAPFFLNGFFFLAGYVYKPSNSFGDLLKKKVKGLLLPWFIFSHFNILLSGIISLKGDRNTLEELKWNLLQIRGLGDGIWFVAALFVAFIPFYFVIRWNKPIYACILSFILALVSSIYRAYMNPDLLPWGTNALPWHLEYIFFAMFWMVLGYYFKLYGEAIFERVAQNMRAIYLSIYLSIYLLLIYVVPETNIDILLEYVKGILGVGILVVVSKKIKSNCYIKFVGANTLTYFALHGKVYAVLEYVMRRWLTSFYMDCLNNVWTSSLLAIAMTILLSILLMVPAEIINRWFPWVLGRKNTICKRQRKTSET